MCGRAGRVRGARAEGKKWARGSTVLQWRRDAVRGRGGMRWDATRAARRRWHLRHGRAQVALVGVVLELQVHLRHHAAQHRVVRAVGDHTQQRGRLVDVLVAGDARHDVEDAREELEAIVAADDAVVARVGPDRARVHHEEARRLDRAVQAAARLDAKADLGRRLLAKASGDEARRAVEVALAAPAIEREREGSVEARWGGERGALDLSRRFVVTRGGSGSERVGFGVERALSLVVAHVVVERQHAKVVLGAAGEAATRTRRAHAALS